LGVFYRCSFFKYRFWYYYARFRLQGHEAFPFTQSSLAGVQILKKEKKKKKKQDVVKVTVYPAFLLGHDDVSSYLR
jgi:hypothetical protein